MKKRDRLKRQRKAIRRDGGEGSKHSWWECIRRARFGGTRTLRAGYSKRARLDCAGIIPLRELAVWAADLRMGSYNDLCIRGYIFGSLVAHYHDRQAARAALARYCELVCELRLSSTMRREILATARLSFTNDYRIEDFIDEDLTETEYDAIHRYIQTDIIQRPLLVSSLPTSQMEAIACYIDYDQFWCMNCGYLQQLLEITDRYLERYGI